MKKWLRHYYVAWMLLFLCSGSARASDPSRTAELIRKLLDRIEKLEKRVAELESRQAEPNAARESGTATKVDWGGAAAPAARAATNALQAASTAMLQAANPSHPSHDQVTASEVQPTYPSLKIAGFGDFNFSATDQRDSRNGFTEGQLVLHLSSALSPKTNVFGEVSFTARPDAGTGNPAAPGFNPEIERLIVRFDQSDYLKLSFGRYHTPINWWNTAFHHGQWLQTSIDRPEMTRFGGEFIPVHFVGALAEGALPAGGANLNYNFGVGNGRGYIISRGGDAGDNNNNRAWLINLFAKPDRLFGFQAGGSVYRDKISLAGGRDFREWITSAHAVWHRETPELIAEFANVNHQEVGGSLSFNSQAFYFQAGYRLPWLDNVFKPYYRFEYINIAKGDPVFRLLPDLNGSIVGLRYDLSSFAALKAEYRNQRRSGQSRINGGFMQVSFTF